MDAVIIRRIAQETALQESSVSAVVGLLERGATGPFIVRYRKEVTGGLDESGVGLIQERMDYYREIRDRKGTLLKNLSEQGGLTDEIRDRIQSCLTRIELEDLQHQLRARKKTRAAAAVEKGLEPLAEYFWSQEPDAWSMEEHVQVYVDACRDLSTPEEAILGVVDILAEWIGGNPEYRRTLRTMLEQDGFVLSNVVPAKVNQKTKYTMYYERREPVAKIPSHRVLAIRRGCKEGVLISSIEGDHAKALEYLLASVIKDRASVFAPVLEAAVREAYSRVLKPLVETEVRMQLKERADREAIRVFQENLANLLLSPPASPIVTMGMDWGKNGECSVAVVSETGAFLEGATVRFTTPGKAHGSRKNAAQARKNAGEVPPAGERTQPAPDPAAAVAPGQTPPGGATTPATPEAAGETASAPETIPAPPEDAPETRDAGNGSDVAILTDLPPVAPMTAPDVKDEAPAADNAATAAEDAATAAETAATAAETAATATETAATATETAAPATETVATAAETAATAAETAATAAETAATAAETAATATETAATATETAATATETAAPDAKDEAAPAAETAATATDNAATAAETAATATETAAPDAKDEAAPAAETAATATEDAAPAAEDAATATETAAAATEYAAAATKDAATDAKDEAAPVTEEKTPEAKDEAAPAAAFEQARQTLKDLILRHAVSAVAIGAGPRARELETSLRRIIAEENLGNIMIAAVNEAGIAIYASSRIAREEFPEWSPSARCAVSLARRLQDPLSELVKVDPKLIGVGQYQHDVDQKELHRKLVRTVQACVNKVGVNINTAGESLLRYVSGLNEKIARRITACRKTAGPFPSRASIPAAVGLDEASFEQAAAFLRIPDGASMLDRTAIHPESYPVVERMAAACGAGVDGLVGNREKVVALKLEDFVTETAGIPTLKLIREELLHPGRDPRKPFKLPRFRTDVTNVSELQPGMTLEGTVTNVTNFGAFVDIGIQQDGLVHLSQMSNRFIRDPREAVKVGDIVKVKVLSVESETNRIGLSMKALLPSAPKKRKKQPRPPAPGQRRGGEKPDPPARGKKTGEDDPPRPGAETPGHRRPRPDRPRRRGNTAPAKAQNPAQEPSPDMPEASLEEKIAILQSKFRRIN